MSRCFALLCSAVVIRLIGGMSEMMGDPPEWVYPQSAWVNWVLPLAVYEVVVVMQRRGTRRILGNSRLTSAAQWVVRRELGQRLGADAGR